MSYLELSGVGKIYTSGTLVTQALRNVSFSAEAGELVVILGSSVSAFLPTRSRPR